MTTTRWCYALLWKRYDNNKMVAMRYYSKSSTVQSQTELGFFGDFYYTKRLVSLIYKPTYM